MVQRLFRRHDLPGRSGRPSREVVVLASLLPGALALAVFLPAVGYDFAWDDGQYLLLNPHLARGLGWESLRWAFTSFYAANWHPLTWLSHLLDVTLFGLAPGGHHLVSILFHAADSSLLSFVLYGYTAALWPSVFTALLFAVHPLHVESVAWVAERKDVLSAFFWLLAMAAYRRYTQRKTPGAYLSVLALFTLGLGAKPMLVTFPFVLLLLDFWPLGRFRSTGIRSVNSRSDRLPGIPADGGRAAADRFIRIDDGRPWSALILEKIPFLALSAASSVVTYLAQARGEAVTPYPLAVRLENAALAYVRYLLKMVWPSRLSVMYPHEAGSLSPWMAAAAFLALMTVTLLVIRARTRVAFLAVGWFWYLGTLVPVIGLVQIGTQAMADRYTYLPFIGPFIMVAWGIDRATLRLAGRPVYLKSAAVVLITALIVASSFQLRHWRDNFTLFRHAVAVTSRNKLAHHNLGVFLQERGNIREAKEQYEAALRVKRDYAPSLNNLGLLLAEEGRMDEALALYQDALQVNPWFAPAENGIGALLAGQGRHAEAEQHYRQAIRDDPGYGLAHLNLGKLLVSSARADKAEKYFREAVRLMPGSAEAHAKLGAALANRGELGEAVFHFRAALDIDPGDAVTRANLARARSSGIP